MFDVDGPNLPVLTSGNSVIKGWVIKWPVKPHVRFLNVFFSKSKKHDFLRFLSCCTRFLEQCCLVIIVNMLAAGHLTLDNRQYWCYILSNAAMHCIGQTITDRSGSDSMKWKTLKFLRSSQRGPVKPCGHWQRYGPVHCPPFRHGRTQLAI